jgi:acylphosphatase
VIRRRVLVEGRVQGVGYRASCAQRARAAGVGGLVRNLPDGGVEAVFEGPRATVDGLVDWCRHGPAYAHVDRLQIVDEEPVGETQFRVA